MAFLEDWKKHKSDTEEHEFIDSEAVGIKYILEHEEVFDYKIGAVYVDNKLEAFTIGNYEVRKIWFIFRLRRRILKSEGFIHIFAASF